MRRTIRTTIDFTFDDETFDDASAIIAELEEEYLARGAEPMFELLLNFYNSLLDEEELSELEIEITER